MLRRTEPISSGTPATLSETPGAAAVEATEGVTGEVSRAALLPGEDKIIEVFVQFSHALGMPRSLAEIYGLLFATPKPLAFQEIVDRLGISKGSASQGLRFLRAMGAVTPVSVAGDRREFFQPVVELRKLVAGFLRERLEPQLDTWGRCAKELTTADFAAPDQPASTDDVLRERIGKFRNWQKRANAILPTVSRLLG